MPHATKITREYMCSKYQKKEDNQPFLIQFLQNVHIMETQCSCPAF